MRSLPRGANRASRQGETGTLLPRVGASMSPSSCRGGQARGCGRMSNAEQGQAWIGGMGVAGIWAGPQSAWDMGTGDDKFGSSPARQDGV